MLEVEIFYCWGINFVGPLLKSNTHEYILVVVDYMSKWVQAIIVLMVDSRIVIKFLKRNIFCKFGTPRVLISDEGTHFCNSQVRKMLKYYHMKHKIETIYHPQINRQAKVSNRKLETILEKTIANSRKDWFVKLDETL